jgi:hypothetical protein
MGNQRMTVSFTTSDGRTITFDPSRIRSHADVIPMFAGMTVTERATLGATCEIIAESLDQELKSWQ